MNNLGIQRVNMPPDGIHLNWQRPMLHTWPIGSRNASTDHLMKGIPWSGSQHIDDKLLGPSRLQVCYRVQNIRLRSFHLRSVEVWLMASNHPNDVGGKLTGLRIPRLDMRHSRSDGSSQFIQAKASLPGHFTRRIKFGIDLFNQSCGIFHARRPHADHTPIPIGNRFFQGCSHE